MVPTGKGQKDRQLQSTPVPTYGTPTLSLPNILPLTLVTITPGVLYDDPLQLLSQY